MTGQVARNFTTNVPKIVELKLSSEPIFSKNWRLGASDWSHWSAIVTLKITYWKYWLHVNIKGAISCTKTSPVRQKQILFSLVQKPALPKGDRDV